jgi:hypothetical protein
VPKPAPAPEFIEGPEAFKRFQDAMKEIVSVSKDELKRREAAWRQKRTKTKRKER